MFKLLFMLLLLLLLFTPFNDYVIVSHATLAVHLLPVKIRYFISAEALKYEK